MKKLLLILLCLPMIGLAKCISGDCVNGYGTYKFDGQFKGHKYIGEWKNGIQNGQGTYIWGKGPNKGDKYVGEWKNDKQNGQGIMTIADGTVYKGLWKDGEFIGSRDIELDVMTDSIKSDGVWVNGEFINGSTQTTVITSHVDQGLKTKIQKFVEQKVNEWQEKGEFEKTNDYLVRVNERNRMTKIKEYQEIALQEVKDEFLKSISWQDVKLGAYDADNETFILTYEIISSDILLIDVFANIVLSVPINEAKEFKESFSSYKFLNPECQVIDNKLCLSYVEVTKGGDGWITHHSYSNINGKSTSKSEMINVESKIYTYNLSNTQDYSITDIEYEFSSIEIDDIKSSKTTKSSNISTNRLKVSTSPVNINIPTNSKVKNRYALVIGNEDYQSKQRGLSDEQNVDYAINDAKVFKEYALKTLGVKEENMYFMTDATSVEMNRKIQLISKIIKKLGNKAELIVYYAGHGYPDENTKVPYLIPVDVPASDLSYAIKLDDFYKDLGSTGAKNIMVFLDACFTGGGRESGLIASRGVKVKPKEGEPTGNTVVFSASSGNQSALPYHKQGHGMFTYHLLKKIQESKGKVSMGELADYIKDKVSIQSLKTNEKEQDPTVNTSPKVQETWRDWEF